MGRTAFHKLCHRIYYAARAMYLYTIYTMDTANPQQCTSSSASIHNHPLRLLLSTISQIYKAMSAKIHHVLHWSFGVAYQMTRQRWPPCMLLSILVHFT